MGNALLSMGLSEDPLEIRLRDIFLRKEREMHLLIHSSHMGKLFAPQMIALLTSRLHRPEF